MTDPDPIPKLRVLEEEDRSAEQEVVRLKTKGSSFESAAKVARPAAKRSPERLEGPVRDHFGGRSIEPGIDAILDPPELAENIESPWGGVETRVAGIPHGWFILLVVLALGAGAWSLRSMKHGEAKAEQVNEVVREKVQEDEKADADASNLVAAVEIAVKGYLAADSIEGILPFIRDPERVRPLIEETWAASPRQPLRFIRLGGFQPAMLGSKPFWVVQAEVKDGPPLHLALEQTGEFEVKVDWESQVCYQPMSWDRFAIERPAGKSMEFRVSAVRDTHFSHEFFDQGSWSCFRLSAKDSEQHVFGYAPTDSEATKALNSSCARSRSGIATVILSLRAPEDGTSPRGVIIEKMVEPRWVRIAGAPKNAP